MRTSYAPSHMTPERLRACLAEVPKAELQGMALVRECHPDAQFFPPLNTTSRERLIAAITEMVAYTERSRRLAERLAQMPPIVLTTFSLTEYGL